MVDSTLSLASSALPTPASSSSGFAASAKVRGPSNAIPKHIGSTFSTRGCTRTSSPIPLSSPACCKRRPPGSWVVVDEVQRLPGLLNEVHRFIEDRQLRFALLGSSARKLKTAGTNLLAGRALWRTMFPLVPEELGAHFDLLRILRHGSIPTHLEGSKTRAARSRPTFSSTCARRSRPRHVVRNLPGLRPLPADRRPVPRADRQRLGDRARLRHRTNDGGWIPGHPRRHPAGPAAACLRGPDSACASESTRSSTGSTRGWSGRSSANSVPSPARKAVRCSKGGSTRCSAPTPKAGTSTKRSSTGLRPRRDGPRSTSSSVAAGAPGPGGQIQGAVRPRAALGTAGDRRPAGSRAARSAVPRKPRARDPGGNRGLARPAIPRGPAGRRSVALTPSTLIP